MRVKRTRTYVVLAAVAALGLGACGGGGGGGGSDSSGAKSTFNAGIDNVVNPSAKKGGILKLGQSGDWADTVDPGETYYGYSWNFLRTFTRPLLMFKPVPGKASEQLVPDLAEDLGKASDGGKTWTYKIRSGVKFEDGSTATSKDVKYAVLRSTDKKTFPSGPAYFEALLDLPKGYDGPFRTPDINTDSAIETPDDQTIVFHLKQPFAGFDYLAQLPQTAPVPQAKDKGAKYREHVVSTGPYKWKTYEAGKKYVLERNDQWDPKTDPNRKALPDGYDITLNMEPNDVDNQVIAGSLDADIQALGVQPAARSRVLTDPALKARADNPVTTRLQYTSINPTVKPFDNIDCRKAIMYGMDRKAYQTAYGGPFAGGEMASTLLPPTVPGHQDFDLYPAGSDNSGDLDKAKAELQKCGKPDGFETSMAYRAERPNEKATAEAFQQALDRVGIKLNLKPLPEGTYFTETCGLPPYVVKNDLGLCVNSWGADWPDGYGFLSQIVDSRVIRETGGSSNTSVRIPEVDKMLDKALVELDDAKRNELYSAIDKRVMEEAVIYPGVYGKLLLLRSKNATNMFANEALGQFDYLAMGAAQ